MPLKVIREGIGRGAARQYGLLKPYWVNDGLSQEVFLYWNAFTRDLPAFELRKRRGYKIVSRVGGWHFGESEERTQWVLERSDAAIYVSEYTRRLAHKRFKRLPKRETVITNSVGKVNYESLGRPPYLLVRAGGLGYPVWRVWMLSRSLSIFCIHAIWPQLRERYPSLQLRVRGRADHKIKEKIEVDGIRFMEYTDDKRMLHNEGSQATALVHLVIGDHSPNTAAEMVGEGRPVICLEKGGTRGLVGRAGIVVPTVPSSERSDLDVWWPLDEKTYRPDLDHLFGAVCNAIDNHDAWRNRAHKRADEISPAVITKKYLEFVESL
jgi:hypothetical protein